MDQEKVSNEEKFMSFFAVQQMDVNELIEKFDGIFEGRMKEENASTYDTEIAPRLMELFEHDVDLPSVSHGHRKERIVISLSTIKERLEYVAYPIKCMLIQTVKPDIIVLWVDNEIIRKNDIPEELERLRGKGLEIRLVEDIGPHTKYYYALQEFRGDAVITIDDDMFYDRHMVEELWEAHVSEPEAVCARMPLRMKYTSHGMPYPLRFCFSKDGTENLSESRGKGCLFAQGVNGVLYPPGCIEDSFFDKRKIRETCPKADDIWLYVAECLSGTSVIETKKENLLIPYIPSAQVVALRYGNQTGGNDRQFKNCFEKFGMYGGFTGRSKPENDKNQAFILWIELLQQGRRVGTYLERKGIGSIAIWGMGHLGKLLARELSGSDITIRYGIDRKTSLYADFPIYRIDEDLESVDMLIFTAPLETRYVCSMLSRKAIEINEICSLEDIFVEMQYEVL